jgi:hypothetical protein
MSNLRFLIACIATFAAAFAGMNWASSRVSRNAPPPAAHPKAAIAKPLAQEAQPAPIARIETIEPALREPPAPPPVVAVIAGPRPDHLRETALGAAQAFAAAPCDAALRAALIVAASSYLRARDGTDDIVHAAMRKALAAGTIAPEEMPSAPPAWFAARGVAPSCAIGRQAAR